MFVVQEAAGAEEALIAGQFADNFRGTRCVAIVQIVNGAHVVHAAARHIIAGLCERDTHHPAGAQRDHLRLVARPRVPDNELAVQ